MYDNLENIFPLGFIQTDNKLIPLSIAKQSPYIKIDNNIINHSIITQTITNIYNPDNSVQRYYSYNIYDVNDFNQTNKALLNDYGQIIYREHILGKDF